jgi:short-subunit dehydrogenase
VKSKGIKVQVVPGAIDTDFYRDFSSVEKNIFFKKFKIMSPESVVDSSLKDLEKNMVVSIPGAYYKNLMVLVSILPRSYWYKRIDKSIT